MKHFEEHVFDLQRGQAQLAEFRALLDRPGDLKEDRDLRPFFRARADLSALIGLYHRDVRGDRLAYEYDLFGDFACDLAIGDSVKKAYCFVELEDATSRSLFVKQGAKATREWSARFEHGFGQIVDWFYKLEDRRNSDEYEARFGKRAIDFAGVLIVGRDRHLRAGERLRLEWRRQHVLVHSRPVICLTYDELFEDLQFRVERYGLGAQTTGRRKR